MSIRARWLVTGRVIQIISSKHVTKSELMWLNDRLATMIDSALDPVHILSTATFPEIGYDTQVCRYLMHIRHHNLGWIVCANLLPTAQSGAKILLTNTLRRRYCRVKTLDDAIYRLHRVDKTLPDLNHRLHALAARSAAV